jgi:hypothetical protein
VDFAEEISRAVAACKVLLVIIGPGWLTAADERGGRQLNLSSMGRLWHLAVPCLPGTETTVCGWRIAFSSADRCCRRHCRHLLRG